MANSSLKVRAIDVQLLPLPRKRPSLRKFLPEQTSLGQRQLEKVRASMNRRP